MAKIHTPIEGFTGVRAGVAFADGSAETTDQTTINYFLRHGYTVEQEEETPKRSRRSQPKKPPAKDAAAGQANDAGDGQPDE